jgi:hypothetical protein
MHEFPLPAPVRGLYPAAATGTVPADLTDRLVGFDARLTHPASWNTERRGAYLYRPELTSPRSVDRNVWPSVFDLHPELEAGYTGPQPYWWEDLAAMEVAAAEVPEPWVAVAALADDGFVPTGREEPRPPRLDGAWRRLGLDVVDSGGLSGLMNMGFLSGADDAGALRARWARHLDERHLFTEPAEAEAFRMFSDRRVVEHAPFHVVELWVRG